MSDWKVDPDHRRRLLQLQKIGENKKCVDCNAPNPQWASPKFGVFICLECAGIHRGLGVHISFVRSITMDQFKPEELIRMEKGGNQPFNEYMTSHGIDLKLPQRIKYDNPIANDYKEKLNCEVEGKHFVEPDHPDFDPSSLNASNDTISHIKSSSSNNSRTSIPLENRRSVTPKPSATQKEKNEAYFADLGKANQSKPDHLPPSQGGKYQGFGSSPVNPTVQNQQAGGSTITLENLQNDPMGTLSRGWGLFSSAITKSIGDVNESVIKPGVQQWQSGEISEETKRAATQFGQKFQETSNYGYEAVTNFAKNIQDQYYNPEGGQRQTNVNGSYTSVPSDEKSDKKAKSSNAAEEWDEF